MALSCGPTVGQSCWSDASSSTSVRMLVVVEEIRPLLDCSQRYSSSFFFTLLVLGVAKLKKPNIADGVQTLRDFLVLHRSYDLLGLFTTKVFIHTCFTIRDTQFKLSNANVLKDQTQE